MKFIDKIFSDKDAGWKTWLLSEGDANGSHPTFSYGYLWRIVADELNAYRSITYVNLGNGASTSFWFDHWLPDGPLCSSHAALFSHTILPNISVRDVFLSGFDLRLRPSLTSAASDELCSLLSCLQGLTLTDRDDARLLKLTGKPFTTRDAYAALDSAGDAADAHGRRIWSTHLPNKVKIFSWLFSEGDSAQKTTFTRSALSTTPCASAVDTPWNVGAMSSSIAIKVKISGQLSSLLMWLTWTPRVYGRQLCLQG